MIETIKKASKEGLFFIVGSSTINKIASLCSGIIIVRLLSKNDYGIYSYVLNVVTIALLLNGLGTITAMLQFGCENRKNAEKKNSCLKYGLVLGLTFNSVLSVVIVMYGLFFPQSIDNTSQYFVMAAFIPITSFASEAYCIFLRVDEENKKYSILNTTLTVLTLGFVLLGAVIWGISGAIIFRYIAIVIILIIGFLSLKSIRKIVLYNNICLQKEEKKSFVRFSLASCANNSVSHLLYNADIFLIGVMIASAEDVASYKVATTIPLALTFITASIITFVYPKFVANRNDYSWLKVNYKKLLLFLLIVNGIITLACVLLAPYIIRIVFGQGYVQSSTLYFRILILGFFFSSMLKIPSGSIFDMLHLIKQSLILSIVTAILNVLLDIILIIWFGSLGAAIATTLTYLLCGIMSNCVLIRCFIKMKNAEIAKGEK